MALPLMHLPSFSFVKLRHEIIAECAPELNPLLFVSRRHTNRIGRRTNRLLCTETEFLDGISNAARTGELLERTWEHAAVSEDDGNLGARAEFARRMIRGDGNNGANKAHKAHKAHEAHKADAVALIMCPLVDISPCKIERARRLGNTQRYAHLKIAAGFIASASIDNATKRMAASWNAVLFKSDKKRRLNVSRQHAILRGVTKIMTARDRDQSQIALVRVATLPTNIRIHIAKFLYHTVPVPT